MSKIKKIEISDFRIFEGKEDFNFERDNGVANLVVLYAPNGFGKTSFFDAIEWGFSDKIKRFENNYINKAIKDEQEDTILLTNNSSYKSGLKGKVKIVTENNSFLEKTVQKWQKRGTTFYNDYRQGKLSNNAITTDLSDIPETNILTQDQIDIFLRFKTPEEKFTALKDFWPQSEDATIRLKQLSELLKVILKNIDNTDSELKEYEGKLESLTKDNKNIKQINAWLLKIKTQETYKCNISIEKIYETISQESYDIIYEENLRNIKGIALRIDDVELIKSELNRLKDTLANYISASKKIIVSNKELIQLQNRKSHFLNLKKSNEIEKSISKDIAIIKLRIEKYKYIDYHILGYKFNVKKIKNFKNENQSSLLKNTRILDHIKIIKESVFNFIQYEKQCNVTRLEIEKKESNIDKQYDDFTLINEKLKEQGKELTDLKSKINKKEFELEKFQKSIQDLNKILEEEVYPDTIILENQDYIELYKNLKENSELINQLKIEVKLKQKELDKSGSLNENLDKLILFGEDYIIKTNSSNCPLCKTAYESFEDLIHRVKLDKIDTLKLSEQKNEIFNSNNAISELKKTKVVLIESINKIILFNKDEISKKINISQEEKNKLINQINDINNTSKVLKYELRNCIDFFNNTFGNTIAIIKISIDSLKKNIYDEILNLTKKENRLNNITKTKEDILLEKESQLLTNQNKIHKNKNSIESIQAQETHQKTTKTLDELDLTNTELEGLLINEKLKIDEEELSNKSENFSLISKGLISIKKNLKDDKLQIGESNIEGNIYDTANLIKKYNESIEDYESKFKKHITSEEIKENAINDHQLKSQNTLDDLLILKKDLNTLNIDLELIKENIKRNELEKKIKKLKTDIPRLQNSFNKIDAAKKDCMSYVQTGINNYFNKDVINEVYSRIEPHPKLTKIDFSTDFNDKGEPRLLIKTGNENDDKGVNPVLFLSAGQVNVLSLSIFLAKAFEYGNKTIETIFMDDPIQNLSDINVLSFIDLLRTLISTHDKQIVISTHDERFFRLLQNKLPEEYCNTKYFEFESEGKLKKTKTQQTA